MKGRTKDLQSAPATNYLEDLNHIASRLKDPFPTLIK